jgi:hypothetical protein
VRSLESPPHRLDVGVGNPVMSLGFALLPRLYDLLVGPLFAIAAQGPQQVPASAGNVLDPVPEGAGLRGRAPSLSDRVGALLHAVGG